MKSLLIASLVCLVFQTFGQTWNHTYDMDQVSNVCGSAQPTAAGEYVSVMWILDAQYGGLCLFKIDMNGDTVFSNCFRDSIRTYSPGLSGSILETSGGDFLFGGTLTDSINGLQSLMILYTTLGDTLWTYSSGGLGFENLNQVWENNDGTFSGFGLKEENGNEYLFHLIVDTNGAFIDLRLFQQPADVNCMSGRQTQDGGFVLSGQRSPSQTNTTLFLMKTDSAGNVLWEKDYGSPWNDNVAFVEEMPNGNLILSGAVRLSSNSLKVGWMAETNSNGSLIWQQDYPGPLQILFTRPVVLQDGFAAAGSQFIGSGILGGVLHKVDTQGNELWRRTYQTNSLTDHYFYDVRATQDGGFIMAGSAFDSLVTSQDAWLVKVDSFGCLVPGCQGVGIDEQITDMGNVIKVFPNPVQASGNVSIQIDLPAAYKGKELQLALVDQLGRSVSQFKIHDLKFKILAPSKAGVYYLHLSNGTRWLSGTKMLVQ